MMSRRILLATALGTTGLAVVGCAGERPVDTAAAGPSAGSVFPVTVQHKFGSTVVRGAPRRVVSVGVTEQDALLALGVKPLAVTEWYGEQPLATWSWARPLFGDAQPMVLSTSDGFEIEKIAQLAPDLIIGTNAGIEKADYDKLSALAPTIPNKGGYPSDYFEPWDLQTQMIGEALGKASETAAMITSVKRQFATAAAAHPEFAGKKVIFSQGAFSEGAAISSQEGLGTSFLTDLGLTIPKVLDQYSKDGAQAYVPVEKLDIMNEADVLIWASDDAKGAAERLANPVYQKLTPVREGRSIETGELLAAAIYFSSVLSVPYVAEQLVPKLSAVLKN